MPAVALPALEVLPLRHGLLHVTGSAHERPSTDDAAGVLIDQKGDVCLIWVAAAKPRQSDNSAREALAVARETLRRHAPLYELVTVLRSFGACNGLSTLGATIVRFSQSEARVELLNAGMPAVTCILPNGRAEEHAALSPAIGERYGATHPYELAPLLWGSAWFLLPAERTHDAAPDSEGDPRLTPGAKFESACVLAVHSDPYPRFQSGFVRG